MQSLNRQSLDTLATYLEPVADWSELVVSDLVGRELAALEARCRERENLRARAGRAFARTLNRGVRALLSGPSGTGKTLAARALAAVLHMDLYRVDLAAVVNKYIGETERNLNEVFSRAEELDVVLLLDEGDALMTQRTDVQSSNDRYANLETNYLLQRLETYEGIVLVTTNAGKRIDSAFMRRLDVTIEFALPDAAERRRLWEHHLPAQHAVSPALLGRVVQHCALSGGQIRNAALYATLIALKSPDGVSDDHLQEALRREYRKAGAAYPLHARAAAPTQLEQLQQFTAEIHER
jgi:SpoVK/Ycf46/Vps4 family AAA+-type ATPase